MVLRNGGKRGCTVFNRADLIQGQLCSMMIIPRPSIKFVCTSGNFTGIIYPIGVYYIIKQFESR